MSVSSNVTCDETVNAAMSYRVIKYTLLRPSLNIYTILVNDIV